MKFALVINEAPYSRQASESAYQFAKAVVAKGYTILSVFFYGDGVLNANTLACPPQDEAHIINRWSAFAKGHHITLSVCVASCLRRGILDETLSRQYDKTTHNLAAEFTITGLGTLAEAYHQADRVILFGG